MKNLYIFTFDIEYGLEEFFTRYFKASTLEEAINNCLEQENKERDDDEKLDEAYFKESISHITIIEPDFTVIEITNPYSEHPSYPATRDTIKF